MITQLQQLYPTRAQKDQCELRGLYLEHALHRLGSVDKPMIYANFVSSLDGRIAIKETPNNEHDEVPQILTSEADWVLFQELQAQADCFVTHGGYLRALAAGRLDNILQVGLADESHYLLDWRKRNGLSQQPAVVVASASLNFPPPQSLKTHGQAFHIVTGNHAERMLVRAWQAKGYQIHFAGKSKWVEGRPLVDLLSELGYRSIYLEAGPLLLETLLRDRLLDRIYLTQSHALIGAEQFRTLLGGPALNDAGKLKLRSLYYDAESEKAVGQFFSCFEPLDV